MQWRQSQEERAEKSALGGDSQIGEPGHFSRKESERVYDTTYDEEQKSN